MLQCNPFWAENRDVGQTGYYFLQLHVLRSKGPKPRNWSSRGMPSNCTTICLTCESHLSLMLIQAFRLFSFLCFLVQQARGYSLTCAATKPHWEQACFSGIVCPERPENYCLMSLEISNFSCQLLPRQTYRSIKHTIP